MLVAIDTSFSIPQEDMDRFFGEIETILEIQAIDAMADEHAYYNQFGE